MSNIDGVLGYGTTLSTAELSTSDHSIALKVTDSDGTATQVVRTIHVAQEDAAEAVNLDIAPFGVGAVAEFGGAVQETLSVRSSSDVEFDWTASEDVSWLSLDTTSGQTPSDLVLTIDPSGLAVGTYTGKITFSSGEAGNSPVEIEVTLQVTGHAVHLPLIVR